MSNVSCNGFTNLENCLSKYIPIEELSEVKRILYGESQEKVLKIPDEVLSIATKHNFEIKGFIFEAQPESTRKKI